MLPYTVWQRCKFEVNYNSNELISMAKNKNQNCHENENNSL